FHDGMWFGCNDTDKKTWSGNIHYLVWQHIIIIIQPQQSIHGEAEKKHLRICISLIIKSKLLKKKTIMQLLVQRGQEG
ncbi:MAG: hypothetical protein WCI01_05765, partial [Chlorobiaceae bacterium]